MLNFGTTLCIKSRQPRRSRIKEKDLLLIYIDVLIYQLKVNTTIAKRFNFNYQAIFYTYSIWARWVLPNFLIVSLDLIYSNKKQKTVKYTKKQLVILYVIDNSQLVSLEFL